MSRSIIANVKFFPETARSPLFLLREVDFAAVAAFRNEGVHAVV